MQAAATQTMAGLNFSDVFLVEVFCGKAGLSRALRRRGFQVFSIDHKAVKGVPILMIDLNSEAQCKIFDELLEQRRLLYVHFAPPCGTASSRCIKLGRRHGPPPLRSLLFPMGLKNLSPKDRERVQLANRLYKLTWKYIKLLDSKGIGWSVENPASSLMWVTTPFTELMQVLKGRFHGVLFHTCMFGAPRKKQTALWTNIEELKQLCRQCNDEHEHAPWGFTEDGQFATAAECAYNSILSAHWAQAIHQYAIRLGLTPPPETLDAITDGNLQLLDKANKAVLGALPRGNKVPPLLTDFLRHQIVKVSAYPFLSQAQIGTRLADNSVFPKGARLLRMWNDQVGKEELDLFAEIGIPVPPMDYLQQACQLVHPEMREVKLSEGLEKTVQMLGRAGGMALRRTRISWTSSVVELARHCAQDEQQLVETRPSHLVSVLKGKRFATLHAALKKVDYEDAEVALEANQGFPLAGWMKRSQVFASCIRPPEMHVETLVAMTASYNARTLASVKASGDQEMDREVWASTLAEVEGGSLEGPYEASELPPGHLVSPRFGLRQGAKVRPIDNMSASGLNSTVGLPEKLQVDTVDEIAAVIKRCMQVHGKGCKLVGRTYDLKRAYRQLGVNSEHFSLSWVAVWSPEDGRVRLFRMKGLPFGGTASVASFLRMSRALRELGVRGAALAWSSFFDDFVCVSPPDSAASADMAIRFLFKSFGWVLSEEPDKNSEFSETFGALGVLFDLTQVSEGVLRVGNTVKRRLELKQLVEGHLQEDCLGCDAAESLRSRLMFAEGQIFGRCAKLALRCIGQPALERKSCKPLTDDVKFALRWMLDRLVHSPPREIKAVNDDALFLFIDGACEQGSDDGGGSVTSVGAVLVDRHGRGLFCFGTTLPDEVTELWGGGRRTQLVFEAEILPYRLALECWSNVLAGRFLIVFIDNDGARHSWIRGTADSRFARGMIHEGTLLEAKLQVSPYFARVPTASNIGDGPSRLDFTLCDHIGCQRTFLSTEMLRKCATP